MAITDVNAWRGQSVELARSCDKLLICLSFEALLTFVWSNYYPCVELFALGELLGEGEGWLHKTLDLRCLQKIELVTSYYCGSGADRAVNDPW